jgi:hypothetical protein
VNCVARIVSVEERRIELTNARETVLDNPITPATAVLAVAGLSPRTPNSISKHRAKSSGMGRDIGVSTNQMVEVVGGGSGKVQLVVNVSDSSKHRRAIAKDMRSGVVGMRAEPTAKVGTMSARICEDHVVGD